MAKIQFTKSAQTIDFDDACESILEAAEAAGLSLDFGCRMGNCTACQQPLQSGQVSYPQGHSGEPDEGNALLCCCVPVTDLVIDA
jgi:ferredoxin